MVLEINNKSKLIKTYIFNILNIKNISAKANNGDYTEV